jgi:predicted anti-sigma-YlaC factor YlaD
MALLAAKGESVVRIAPEALEFLVHIETCESCRNVFEEMRTFIDAIRTTSKRRRERQLVKRNA